MNDHEAKLRRIAEYWARQWSSIHCPSCGCGGNQDDFAELETVWAKLLEAVDEYASAELPTKVIDAVSILFGLNIETSQQLLRAKAAAWDEYRAFTRGKNVVVDPTVEQDRPRMQAFSEALDRVCELEAKKT